MPDLPGVPPRRTRSLNADTPPALAAGEIEVTEEELPSEGIAALHQDQSLLGFAPAMPISLVEPFEAAGETNHGCAGNAWGIEAVAALQAGSEAGARVKVAILDTGIRIDHPAFEGIRLTPNDNVCNFTDEANEDLNGHGTHCAATVFGRDVDGVRIGIARGVKDVLIGKVLGKGGGSTEKIYQGITWAMSKGAHIISMSLGLDFIKFQEKLANEGYHPREATSLALAGYRANIRLFDTLSRTLTMSDGAIAGSIVVAAAGNDSQRPAYAITVAPPAAGENFLSVGALRRPSPDDPLSIADFSNDEVKCAAPGQNILSAALDGGLKLMSGTSMAVPHVAGIAALWADEELRANGRFVASQVIDKMRIQADPLTHLAIRDVGWGMPLAPRPQARRMRSWRP